MSSDPKKSIGKRFLLYFLRTDQLSLVIAIPGVSLIWGFVFSFFVVHFSTRLDSSLWDAIPLGLFLGLFMIPGFFFAISRAIMHAMSPWVALSTMTAASFCPLIMWRLGSRNGLGVNPFLIAFGCIVLVLAAYFITRLIVKQHR